MKPSPFDIGFRVVGHKAAKRRVIRHPVAFAAYASCDDRAEVEREAFLSFFTFDTSFSEYVNRNESEAGFDGPCAAPWLWWDVDRSNDLPTALRDSRRLSGVILERYREFDEDDLLIFLSGGKGVHVGLKTIWRPDPSPFFHTIAKVFCLDVAESAGIVADSSIYSKTRLFRAPNSRHGKSGLFKRRISLDDLTYLKPEALVERARQPEPFDIPDGPALSLQAADDWSKARREVERRAIDRTTATLSFAPKLAALTLDFIRNGTLEGERAVRLFRAAGNLGEFGCSPELAHALLEEAALDSGLTPSETRRQIESGLNHARRQREGNSP